MRFALEAVMELPDTVYVPDSFKALIDLEFTLMQQKGIYLSKCPRCGRFFVRDLDGKSPYCNRVNSSGMTCAEQINEELGIIAMKNGEAPGTEEKTPEPVPEPMPEETEEKPTEERTEPEHTDEQETFPEPISEPVSEKEHHEPIMIPKELEKRCQRVYNMLYKRIGTLMTEKEFREWSGYLSDTKRDIRDGEAEISQMEEFLDYWETAVRKQSRKRRHKGEPDTAAQPETDVYHESHGENGLSSMFDEAVKAAEDKEDSGISPAGTEAAPEERSFKPFNPPKYSTVLEAMMDGKYKSDELLSDAPLDKAVDDSDITVNGRKITLPNWEKITRE